MRQLKITKNITSRDSVSLDKYLSEVSREPMITVEEEVHLAQKIRDGDHAALQKLASANLRFVVSVAKQFQNQGLSLPDLINEGNIGLMKAAGRFDETRGFRFISYAVWWIRQSIMQAVAEQSRVIRLPLNKVGVLNKIKKTSAILEQELERAPTNNELADAMTLRVQEVTLAIESSSRPVSTDGFMHDESTRLGDFLPDHTAPSPDAELLDDSLTIEVDRALSTLTEQQRDVIRLFYGIGIPRAWSLEEIGEKYEVSRERVRQIRDTAIKRLRGAGIRRLLVGYT